MRNAEHLPYLTELSFQLCSSVLAPPVEDGRILTVAGARLKCRGGVQILTGPVIGKVSATSVRILIETSMEAQVTMFVSLVDEDIPNGRVIAR